jgi:hypothetical protein
MTAVPKPTRVRVLGRGLLRALLQVERRWQRLVVELRALWSARPSLPAATTSVVRGFEPDWRGIYFHLRGRAGETLAVQQSPGMFFRGRRLVATDSSDRPGTKTKITGVFVGSMPQMVVFGPGVLSQAFDPEAVGNEIDFYTCDPMLFITFQVEFLVDCEWSAELWGDWCPSEQAAFEGRVVSLTAGDDRQLAWRSPDNNGAGHFAAVEFPTDEENETGDTGVLGPGELERQNETMSRITSRTSGAVDDDEA